MDKLLKNRAARDEYIERKCEELESRCSTLSSEEYLARIEKSKDWHDLIYKKSLYWKDLPDILEEAVRTGSVHTVRQLALHCLYNSPELETRLLQLAPNQDTRDALLDRSMLNTRFEYEQYPLCFFVCSTFYIHNDQYDAHYSLISYPPTLQDAIYSRFLRYLADRKPELYEYMISQGSDRAELFDPMLVSDWTEYRMFSLGYVITENGIARYPIPYCWEHYTDSLRGFMSGEQRTETGTRTLLSEMQFLGWKFKFDGIRNRFGATGYYYLEHWPEL